VDIPTEFFPTFAPACVTLTLWQQEQGDAEGDQAGEGWRGCATYRPMKTERCETHSDASPNPARGPPARRSCRPTSGSGQGHWFLCDCVTSAQPPALVPVSESYIRRHHEPPWPEHDPDCDFFRDHIEQRAIIEPSPGGSAVGRFPFWPDWLRTRMNPSRG
jgi:hypothetical protein